MAESPSPRAFHSTDYLHPHLVVIGGKEVDRGFSNEVFLFKYVHQFLIASDHDQYSKARVD